MNIIVELDMAMDRRQRAIAGASARFHANGAEDDDDTIARRGGEGKLARSEMKVSSAISGMEGGAGEFSYTRNSQMQSQAINLLKPILEQEISELRIDDWKGSSGVADFGCSVGANTLQYAEICYRSLQQSWRARSGDGTKSPVVQYYFCDLPSNDFNTLFRQLEDWRNRRMNQPGVAEVGDGEEFYTAAVAGSFYGRLLPRGSLHVAISIWSLHWLSQVPDAVVDKSTPAYNKGRVSTDGIKNSAVLEAFAQTAKQDLRNFLLSRAYEVVPGGLVLFYALGRADESHPEIQWPMKGGEYTGLFSKVFEATWEELVVKGIIEEETRDSFNIPGFCHSLDEIREVVESTNAFHIKRLEILQQSYFLPTEVEQILADPEAYGRFTKNLTKSVVNSYIVEHIGEQNTDEFFELLERNAATAAREGKISRLPVECVLAVLIRK